MPTKPGKNVLSMHPVIAGDVFYWDRDVWDKNLFRSINKANAIILPQTVNKELYSLCVKMCQHVFPNYDLRFQWEGKTGDALAFWSYGINHPDTLVFPKVETLRGDHPLMDHQVPELPSFPFVLKGTHDVRTTIQAVASPIFINPGAKIYIFKRNKRHPIPTQPTPTSSPRVYTFPCPV